MKRIISILFTIATLIIAKPALAYNFLYLDENTGDPIGWDNTETIKYYLDPGSLGVLTNDQLHTLLKEAFKLWENASPHANVPKFEFAGYLPEDVNGSNYQQYVTKGTCTTDDLSACDTQAQKELKTVIIFDDKSDIIGPSKICLGGCIATGGPGVFGIDAHGKKVVKQGMIVFSQIYGTLGKGIASTVGVMTHEVGHLLGLAHGADNQQIYLDNKLDFMNNMPTMFFLSILGVNDKITATLNPDDIAGISTIYPSASFGTDLATIKGIVNKADGSPNFHVQVVLRNKIDPICKSYSFLSGRDCPIFDDSACISSTNLLWNNSNFTISAIPPGQYTLEVEEVGDADISKTFTPPFLNSEDLFGDSEFWNDGDSANEDRTLSTEITLAAGEVKSGFDFILNRSEITADRIPQFSLDTFTRGPETECPQTPPIDYAGLIGITEPTTPTPDNPSPSSGSSGGCNLMPRCY